MRGARERRAGRAREEGGRARGMRAPPGRRAAPSRRQLLCGSARRAEFQNLWQTPHPTRLESLPEPGWIYWGAARGAGREGDGREGGLCEPEHTWKARGAAHQGDRSVGGDPAGRIFVCRHGCKGGGGRGADREGDGCAGGDTSMDARERRAPGATDVREGIQAWMQGSGARRGPRGHPRGWRP